MQVVGTMNVSRRRGTNPGGQDWNWNEGAARRQPKKSARDRVELFLYVCGFVDSFPRDVLTSHSTYIDIDLQSTGQTGQGGTVPNNAHKGHEE